jgi:hypothetical protein
MQRCPLAASTRRAAGLGLAGLGLAALLAAAGRARAATAPVLVEVWRTPGCGCCKAWARHLEAAGLAVRRHDSADLAAVRRAAGVPDDLAGCHTARVAGYVVEGHVPVAAVQRLLAERPPLIGLAVPGMPLGSPGMEAPGEPAEAFTVLAFAADGTRTPYLHVAPAP